VFSGSFDEVAVQAKKHELARMWLLGTWIAENRGYKYFNLVNLVPRIREKLIEKTFGGFINATGEWRFLRATWEDIYDLSKKAVADSGDQNKMVRYFEGKTSGYSSKGVLQKAFAL
jgi:hypothetical protein